VRGVFRHAVLIVHHDTDTRKGVSGGVRRVYDVGELGVKT